MSKLKRALLHGLLLATVAVMPVSVFGMTNNDMEKGEPKTDETYPQVEKTASRFHFGVYYGRPYYYRPYYYYYPYRPYYYRYNYYPYYRW